MRPVGAVSVIYLTIFLTLASPVDSSRHRLKEIGVDNETGTRFSIIDEGDLMPMFQTCLGRGAGSLEVFGEVPQNISLAEDTVAKAIIQKAVSAAKRACPKFSLDLNLSLKVSLFKGERPAQGASPIAVSEWKLYDLRTRETVNDYRNTEARKAKETAMIASGNIRPLPNHRFLILSGTDHATGTTYWIYSDNGSNRCGLSSGTHTLVIGEVPNNVSLLNDNTARSLVLKGAAFVREACGSHQQGIRVYLAPPGFTVEVDRFGHYSIKSFQVASEVWYDRLHQHNNIVFEAEQKRLREENQRREQASKEAVRQARWNEFARKYGVQELVKPNSLFKNPFLYQGKTIAVPLVFDQMITASSGRFHGGTDFMQDYHYYFLVENVPAQEYRDPTREERREVLVVRFSGQVIDMTLGPMSIKAPKLRFVGRGGRCTAWDCSEMLGEFLHRR